MGGDDLDSDGEDWLADVAAPASESKDDDSVDVTEQAANDSRKRKLDDAKSSEESKKKATKHISAEKLLIEAGRSIEEQSAEEQAAFLTTAMKHYTLLKEGAAVESDEALALLPRYFCTSAKASLAERFRDAVPMKRLKKWKHTRSPCVVVICISARRAVAILKELSFLKLRIAKLFPKNGDTAEQRNQLQTIPFGVAVGTPHRLSVLAGCAEGENKSSLTFEHTQLIIFDSQLSNKQFSVVSLHDTAPHCITLLREMVLPQLRKRQDIRVAFF